MTPRRDSYYPRPESPHQKKWKAVRSALLKISKPIIRAGGPVVRFLISWDKSTIVAVVGAIITGIGGYTVILSQRADLEFIQIQFSPNAVPVANTPLEISFLTQNVGKSTIHVVDGDLHFFVEHDDAKLSEKPTFARAKSVDSSYVAVVPPDKPQRGSYFPRDKTGQQRMFTEPVIAALNSGAWRFIFYGTITYRDDYSFLLGSRVTGFCAIYDATKGKEFRRCGPEYRAYTFTH